MKARVHKDMATHVLSAAAAVFADHGYAGAPIGEICERAGVTKPTVYYHFHSKAGLFQALLDLSYDETFQIIKAAHDRQGSARERLVDLLAHTFQYTHENPDLIRIAFAAAFSANGEIPQEIVYKERSDRNFELVLGIIAQGQSSGELQDGDPVALTVAFYGLMVIHIMSHLVRPEWPLTTESAEAVVNLFLEGAAA